MSWFAGTFPEMHAFWVCLSQKCPGLDSKLDNHPSTGFPDLSTIDQHPGLDGFLS